MWRSRFYHSLYFTARYFGAVGGSATSPWVPPIVPTQTWTCIEAGNATWTTVARDAETWGCVSGANAASIVISGGAPIILSVSPESGTSGTLLTITGQNFTGVTSVTIDGIEANFTIVDDSTILATVP